jgi:glycosyltransferase involved in cell wall biosynthesis
MERVKVSLCLIVKNEEASLPICLGSAADLVDEIVVVDTGSTDRTHEVSERFGARVYPFPWVDDFSAARNESLRHAAGNWIFWLDADESLDETNRGRLRDLFAGLGDENAAYVMTQRCLQQASLTGPPAGADQDVEQVRLFRRHAEIRWQYRVYEQVLPSVRRLGGKLRHTEVIIQHPGYQNAAVHRGKIERNLRLARLDLAEHDDDAFILYSIGVFEQLLGNFAESIPFLERGRDQVRPAASYAVKLHALLIQAHHRLNQGEEARAACRAASTLFPQDPELLYLEGILLQQAGDLEGAEGCLLQLLKDRPGRPAVRAGANLRSAARAALTVLYQAQGRTREPDVDALLVQARGHLDRKEFAAARQILEMAIARAPHALTPRLALSHVLLLEGRDWEALEKALRDVLAIDPNHAEARHNLTVLLKQRGPG